MQLFSKHNYVIMSVMSKHNYANDDKELSKQGILVFYLNYHSYYLYGMPWYVGKQMKYIYLAVLELEEQVLS